MTGYESVRDNPRFIRHLDAEQLFKYAFALRTEADRLRAQDRRHQPILFYLYAEPVRWPDRKPVPENDKVQHRREIATFSTAIADDEAQFVACSYRQWLERWSDSGMYNVRAHAQAVIALYAP